VIFSNAAFRSTVFSAKVSFLGCNFNSHTGFSSATFSAEANFTTAIFSGPVAFNSATFSEEVIFDVTTFFNIAAFPKATFAGNVRFYDVTFSATTIFMETTFSEKISFLRCNFESSVDFRGCLYPQTEKIDFSGVIDFPQMQNEWTYDPRFDGEKNKDKKRRGLKGHLAYDKTFYVALVEAYQHMGRLKEANDVYYTYRKEGRRRHPNFLHRIGELIFLEITFGYGVKPLMLARSFLILWLPFGLFYVAFLRHRENGSSPFWFFPINRHKLYGFVWGLLHSFSILTPGLDLDAYAAPYLEKSPYRFETKSEWLYHMQIAQRLLGWYLLALFFILFGKIWIR